MQQWQVRQGDYLLVRVDGLPEGVTPEPRERDAAVVGWGEVTGHAHRVVNGSLSALVGLDQQPLFTPNPAVSAVVYEAEAVAARYLEVTGGDATLVHEEHNAVVVPPGTYRLIRQRTYTPAEIRFVAD